MAHGAHAVAVAWTRYDQHDLPNGPREGDLIQHRKDFRLGCVAIVCVPNVEINDDVLIRVDLLVGGRACPGRFAQPRQLSLGGEKANALPLLFIFSRHTRLAIHFVGARVEQSLNPVVAAWNHLEHPLPHGPLPYGKPARETNQWRRTLDQGPDSLLTVIRL